MENQSSKIIFFKTRSLAGRLSAALEFVEKNFKVLLKFTSFLVLPIAILFSFMYVFLGDPAERLHDIHSIEAEMPYLVAICFISLLVILCAWGLISMLYTLIKEYWARDTIANLTFKDVKSAYISNLKRYFISSMVLLVFSVLLAVVIFFCTIYSLWTLVISIPVILYFVVPMYYVQLIYQFEDITIGAAIKKSFKFGTQNWGSTILIAILSSVLALIAQGIVFMPWGIGKIIQYQAFQSVLDGNLSNIPSYFIVVMFFLGVIAYFFTYLAQLFPLIALTFQYTSVTQAAIDKKAVEEELNQVD